MSGDIDGDRGGQTLDPPDRNEPDTGGSIANFDNAESTPTRQEDSYIPIPKNGHEQTPSTETSASLVSPPQEESSSTDTSTASGTAVSSAEPTANVSSSNNAAVKPAEKTTVILAICAVLLLAWLMIFVSIRQFRKK